MTDQRLFVHVDIHPEATQPLTAKLYHDGALAKHASVRVGDNAVIYLPGTRLDSDPGAAQLAIDWLDVSIQNLIDLKVRIAQFRDDAKERLTALEETNPS